MILTKLQQLKKYRAKAAEIEEEWAAHREDLLRLPAKLGYGSVKQLITALSLATGDRAPLVARDRKPRKPRAKITAATKEKVRQLVQSGKTGLQIAKQLHLSPASVQNIKAGLGLTRERVAD